MKKIASILLCAALVGCSQSPDCSDLSFQDDARRLIALTIKELNSRAPGSGAWGIPSATSPDTQAILNSMSARVTAIESVRLTDVNELSSPDKPDKDSALRDKNSNPFKPTQNASQNRVLYVCSAKAVIKLSEEEIEGVEKRSVEEQKRLAFADGSITLNVTFQSELDSRNQLLVSAGMDYVSKILLIRVFLKPEKTE